MKIDKLLYLACAELICFSGGVFFFVEYSRYFLILWVLTCYLLYRKTISHKVIAKTTLQTNRTLFFIITCWILLTTFVTSENPVDNMYVSMVLFPMGTMFLVSSVNFNVFREILLKCFNWILVISIIVHLLHNFGIIPSVINETGQDMSLLFFNTEWGSIETPIGDVYRFSSVYWEPGQLQIVIVFILLLFADQLTSNTGNFLFLLSKFGVSFLSLLLSGSTTGYLCLMFIIVYCLMYSSFIRKYKILLPVFLSMSVFFVFIIFNSSIVSDKLAQKDLDQPTSYSIRLADNIACLNVASEHPLFGLGCNTKALHRQLLQQGNITSSNGWLRSAACFGFLFVAFLIIAMYLGIRQMNIGNIYAILAILILSQCNEYYTSFPYLFLYVFRFRTYAKTDNLSIVSLKK